MKCFLHIDDYIDDWVDRTVADPQEIERRVSDNCIRKEYLQL